MARVEWVIEQPGTRQPRRVACRKRPAISFSKFHGWAWFYTCMCTANTEEYYVMFHRFRPATERADWYRHLQDRRGFGQFLRCAERFVNAGGRVNSQAA